MLVAAKAPSGAAFMVYTRRIALTQAVLRIHLSRSAVPTHFSLCVGSIESAQRRFDGQVKRPPPTETTSGTRPTPRHLVNS
jgi:hypothetical protein